MADTIKKIIEVEVQADQARKGAADLTVQLAKLREEQIALTKSLTVARKAFGDESEQAARAGDALAENRRQVAAVSGEIRQMNKTLDTSSNSLNAMKLRLAAVNKEFDSLDRKAPGAADRLEALRKESEALTNSLKNQEEATGRFQRNVGNYTGSIKKALTSVGGIGGQLAGLGEMAAAGGPIGVAAAGAVVLAKGIDAAKDAAAEFTRELAKLKAVLPETTTKEQIQALEDQALALNHLGFAAKDVVQAQTELAKAGLDANTVLATTPDLLNLAIAGELGLADAATLAADAMTQFNIPADNAGRVMDAFTFIANKTTTSVEMVRESMKMLAPAAATLRVPLEETATAIGLLAQGGLKGEQATASLATSLTRFASPSKEALALMKATGTQLFDVNGKYIGLEGTIREFSRVTANMTDEARLNYISTIAGAEASKQWNILINQGADAFSALNKELNTVTDQNGKYTKSVADMKMDEYARATAQYESAVEDLSISVGKVLLPFFAELARWGTSIIEIFSGQRSLKTSFADFTSAVAAFVVPGSGLSDIVYNWGHAEEFAAKKTEQAAKELAVQTQKKKEAEEQEKTNQKTNEELAAAIAKQKKAAKEEAARNAEEQRKLRAEEKKANEARLLELQEEEYGLQQINALLERGLSLEMARSRMVLENARGVFGNEQATLGGGIPETPASVEQEIGNARVAVAQSTADQLAEIRRAEQQATTEYYVEQLNTVNKYAGEVAGIVDGLGSLWANQRERELQAVGENEEAQLQIKRKYAKREALISSVKAIISGLEGAQKTLANLGLPAAIPFLIAQAGITGTNVAGIISNANKFEDGGLVRGGIFSGPRHAQGGVKFAAGGRIMEAEGGEAILTRKATSMFRPMLSAMNQAGGGRKFETGGMIGAPASVMAGDPFTAAMQNALASMPAPIVRVSDINNVQNAVAVKVQESTL